jgi:hypothetical protein
MSVLVVSESDLRDLPHIVLISQLCNLRLSTAFGSNIKFSKAALGFWTLGT